MKSNNTLIAAIMIMVAMPLTSCAKDELPIDNTPVKALDLNRYLGKWYEIARFNHSFEEGLDNVTAEYSLKDDGKIKVINTGWKDGEQKVAEGKAYVAGTAYLKVSFFLFFYADYKIMMLDEDYSYALVGSKSSKFLWILSRTPELPQETLDAILEEARARGYNTDNLIWVNQDKNK